MELLFSKKIQAIAAMIPKDKLLTETDNPGALKWLTGAIGQPSDIVDVVEKLASLRGCDHMEMKKIIQQNLMNLIRVNTHLSSYTESGMALPGIQ